MRLFILTPKVFKCYFVSKLTETGIDLSRSFALKYIPFRVLSVSGGDACGDDDRGDGKVNGGKVAVFKNIGAFGY